MKRVLSLFVLAIACSACTPSIVNIGDAAMRGAPEHNDSAACVYLPDGTRFETSQSLAIDIAADNTVAGVKFGGC